VKLSACIDLLFGEGGRPWPERALAAVNAGCDAIEMWTWRDKEIAAIARTGVRVACVAVEPAVPLTDPANQERFAAAVAASCLAAVTMACTRLTVLAGDARVGLSEDQQDLAVAVALRRGAEVAGRYGVTLLLEALNRHAEPTTFVGTTPHAARLVDKAGHPNVRLLYDVYHSAMAGEDPVLQLANYAPLIQHVQVADTGGRHEPGSGEVPWERLAGTLSAAGYGGYVGLEYVPSVASHESVQIASRALGAVVPPKFGCRV
jgi:hydroxypyruvate isomerase